MLPDELFDRLQQKKGVCNNRNKQAQTNQCYSRLPAAGIDDFIECIL